MGVIGLGEEMIPIIGSVSRLKPCPFCGSLSIEPFGGDGVHYIGCTTCEAEGPSAESFVEAYELWDKRVKM